MLIEFKTKNYKSFVEETVFSMRAAPKQKGLDYSLFEVGGKSKKIKVISSSVIYGPNASGKTNIIGAMDTFRSLVLRGNIRNSEEKDSPNTASTILELIPNNEITTPEPVDFSIEFYEQEFHIQYQICIDLGLFLDNKYQRKVMQEKLMVNGYDIFTRKNDTLVFGNFKPIKKHLVNSVNIDSKDIEGIAVNSLNREELFLCNGFKLIFSQTFVKLMTDWFKKRFMVIYRADSMKLIQRFSDPNRKTVYIEKTTNKAAKLFGINSNAVGYIVNDDDDSESDAKLISVFGDIKNKKNAVVAAELFESYGTIRFINIFPLVIRAIKTGGILIVDEFDASIHPMALMNIINIFHNDEININHAQLIFNTHNPIFLNSNLFRRDEIKFVERDDDTNNSIIYSLSDFGTAGGKGVRKHEDYMRNYFVNQYGAIKDIDFTPIFEEMTNQRGKNTW